MDGEDLPLSIKYHSICDYLNCPVCMDQMQTTVMTPCGHRYCRKCITECINRHHKCPCCSKAIIQSQLIRDPQFDDMIETINKDKDVSEQEYFERLVNTGSVRGTSSTSGNTESNSSNHTFSPVELVLKKHMKQSLVAHEKYYQDLKKELHRRQEQMAVEYRNAVEDLYGQGLSADDIGQRIEVLQENLEHHKRDLEEDMIRCGNMVAEAFDRHLSEHIPKLSVLPIKVTINILSKDVQVPEVELKPHDSVEDIRQRLQRLMEERGDPIIALGKDVKFLSFGPFSTRSTYEMHHMACDIIEHGATHSDITLLPDTSHPVLQFALKPGTVIGVYGLVQCESDLPKQCFVTTFQVGNTDPVDYFSCRSCNFNWICRSCMEVCHKDHEVVPYIMKHKPTWACCYCPKKKKCVL